MNTNRQKQYPKSVKNEIQRGVHTPREVSVSMKSVANAPSTKPMGSLQKVLIGLGVVAVLVAAGAAVGIPLYFGLNQSSASETTSTSTTGTSVTTTTTTSATTTTTTSVTTTTSRTTTTTSTTTTTTTTSRTTTTTTTTRTTTTTSRTTTTTSTTTTTTTTTRTTTTTTTSVTTTSTTANIATGTQNYATEIAANGYHGVQKFRYYTATNTGSAMRYGYPIVYLSGTLFSGSYVNNAWYALHAGCGNSNGIAGCTGVCKSYNKTYVGITGSCGSGYLGSVTTYVNPDRCVYTSADTISTPWNDYGTASGCGNPMIYCDCTL